MKPYQARVIVEKEDNDEKLVKLEKFIESDEFNDLDISEQDRLERQFNAMTELSGILEERIEAFEESDDDN